MKLLKWLRRKPKKKVNPYGVDHSKIVDPRRDPK